MRALLLDAVVPQHKDAVSELDGRQAEGDRQRRAPAGKPREAQADKMLALVVERARRLVHNVDGRILQK